MKYSIRILSISYDKIFYTLTLPVVYMRFSRFELFKSYVQQQLREKDRHTLFVEQSMLL